MKIAMDEIPANLPTLLTQFPESFQKVIDSSRTPNIEQKPAEIKLTVDRLVQEIRSSTLVSSA